MTDTGIIMEEDVGPEDDYTKAPSLDIQLSGMATVDGTIDLSGNTGWKYYTEDGGNITVQAAGISVAGILRADGATSQEAGYGASGGAIQLISSLALQVTGTISSTGAYGNDYRGGDGGNVRFQYATTIYLRGYTLNIEGGGGWWGSGADGTLVTTQVTSSDIR